MPSRAIYMTAPTAIRQIYTQESPKILPAMWQPPSRMAMMSNQPLRNLKVPVMVLPNDLPANSMAAKKRYWEKRIDKISKKKIVLEENMRTLFLIIWGQVSNVHKHRIQAQENFKEMHSAADSLALLAAL